MSEETTPPAAARIFLIPTGMDRRLIVTVTAEDDGSLPSPLEVERWEASAERPTRLECLAAFLALRDARDLGHHEIAWKREERREGDIRWRYVGDDWSEEREEAP